MNYLDAESLIMLEIAPRGKDGKIPDAIKGDWHRLLGHHGMGKEDARDIIHKLIDDDKYVNVKNFKAEWRASHKGKLRAIQRELPLAYVLVSDVPTATGRERCETFYCRTHDVPERHILEQEAAEMCESLNRSPGYPGTWTIKAIQ